MLLAAIASPVDESFVLTKFNHIFYIFPNDSFTVRWSCFVALRLTLCLVAKLTSIHLQFLGTNMFVEDENVYVLCM